MRIMFLALMIVLLPLRGWVGDAMAMEMMPTTLNQAHHATKSVADAGTMVTHGARADVQAVSLMPAHCADHLSPDDNPSNSPPLDDADCSVSAACQICHSVALTPALPLLTPARLAALPPQLTPHQYASAERAPGFKPPIF